MNVLSNHRNVNANRSVTLSAYDKDICLFMFTFVLQTFFVYALFIFFSKRRLTVHFTYQGCSTAFVQVVGECLCVYVCLRVCKIIMNLLPVLIFSMLSSSTRIDVSFYCDDLTLPNCPFFVFFCFLVLPSYFIFSLSQHWLVGFVLYGCWPCLDLMLPNPIPTEPLKIF